MKRTLLIGGLTAALTGAGPAAATPPTPAQVAALDAASAVPRIYPYWHQAQGSLADRNPFPTR